MKRAAQLGFAVIALCAAAPAPASAGTYDVLACGDAPSGQNNTWVVSNNAPSHLMSSTACPARSGTEGGLDGIRASDRLATPTAPPGSQAEWRFTAPAGTTVVALSYDRSFSKQDDSDWTVYGRTDDDAPFDTCDFAFPVSSCYVGSGAPNQGGRRVLSGLSAASLSVGVRCDAPAGIECATGGTRHYVWAVVYAATVTLQENTLPSVGSPSGSLLTGGWLRGAQGISFTASDDFGIKETGVYVDGTPLASATVARSCDYTHTVPCTSPTGAVDHTVDTTQLADGDHTVEAAAVDAAGNVRRATAVTVRVDNTAPSFAISAPAGETTATTLHVDWTSYDGTGSGVAGHDVEVSVNGGTWQRWLTGTQATTAGYPAEAGNRYRFRGRATDAAGLQSGWGETGEAVVRQPAPAPATPDPGGSGASGGEAGTGSGQEGSDPGDEGAAYRRAAPALAVRRISRRADRVYVSGTLPRDARGRVRITYRLRARGRTVTLRRTARVVRGRFRAALRIGRRLRGARPISMALRYSGDARYRARRVRISAADLR